MLEIKDLNVNLGSFALQNISLKVEKGDYLTILGLSGAGKTVLLEVLAGLIKPLTGKIILNKNDITHESIQKRKLGLVYQDMALFPHMLVRDNIAYSLRGKGYSGKEKEAMVIEQALNTNISHLLDRHPATLSGGEAQRVALARTLISKPDVLLLDEPLASLDIKLREELRTLLRKINQDGTTIIHVTHDYMESATLSNKVAIIENGALIQWGKPQEVFRNPATEFVARFSGIKNIFKCSFNESNTRNGLFYGITPQNLKISILNEPGKEEGHVMIPGEDIIISPQELQTSAVNQFRGKIRDIFRLHHGFEIIIDAGEDFSVTISGLSFEKLNMEKGKQVWISFKASAVKIL
jgi:molybdopterin-binding protein